MITGANVRTVKASHCRLSILNFVDSRFHCAITRLRPDVTCAVLLAQIRMGSVAFDSTNAHSEKSPQARDGTIWSGTAGHAAPGTQASMHDEPIAIIGIGENTDDTPNAASNPRQAVAFLATFLPQRTSGTSSKMDEMHGVRYPSLAST